MNAVIVREIGENGFHKEFVGEVSGVEYSIHFDIPYPEWGQWRPVNREVLPLDHHRNWSEIVRALDIALERHQHPAGKAASR